MNASKNLELSPGEIKRVKIQYGDVTQPTFETESDRRSYLISEDPVQPENDSISRMSGHRFIYDSGLVVEVINSVYDGEMLKTFFRVVTEGRGKFSTNDFYVTYIDNDNNEIIPANFYTRELETDSDGNNRFVIYTRIKLGQGEKVTGLTYCYNSCDDLTRSDLLL